MKYVGFILSLLFAAGAGQLYAQRIPTNDSSEVSPATSLQDSSRKDTLKIREQQFPKHKQRIFDPKVAYKRSLILPGLGQAYNKSYWKIPIVYAGLGAIGYFIYYNQREYKRYRNAYFCAVDTSGTCIITDSELAGIPAGNLRVQRDYHKQNRDLSIMVGVLFYALNVVDAYVEAHLKSFDVSEDLSMRILPNFEWDNNRQNFIFGAGITFKFKK